MSRIAISGHRGLPSYTSSLVEEAIYSELANRRNVTGVSCIADGPDSMFAQAVIDNGGTLIVVVPSVDYRDSLPVEHHATYDALMSQAITRIELGYQESNSESHMDASVRMLEEADEMIAVWDGDVARGYGGTADVVSAARDRGVPITVLWPEGATRD